MITRLPRWVWSGAWLLALSAGMVNVAGLLGVERQAISHLTGTTSQLGAAMAALEAAVALAYVAYRSRRMPRGGA